MRDNNNKFVNNKDFGKIAKSTTASRGSNTPTQVGDQNMRESYNASRDVKKPTLSGQPGPRLKQLSSYKKDGGASRAQMRRGGSGK
jgi:hypothetical protein